MSEDFRQKLSHDWRMHRVREAVEAYRDAIDTAWYTLCRELRAPCRVCKQWPCTCNGK